MLCEVVGHRCAGEPLLEPEGPDSLFAWGKLSTALEQKEYIDVRNLDPLAVSMLAKDPKLAAAWEEERRGG